ncbi:hypothetical protein Bca52824_063507 [Brassica carinata]|uniref:Uncharacterized protein n=1 Tax=Brassica carinata TaxID=52824 RepID=A0A8X7U7R3_BRACI|nr:hypothetical protein Bca52824_063507 [Brassica carinata]
MLTHHNRRLRRSNGDSSVFSCLLRRASLGRFASPPSSLVKPVRRRTETYHNRRLSQSSPHLLLRFSSSPSEE